MEFSYFLNYHEKYTKKNIGLYRDDGLIILKEPKGPKLVKYRKKCIETTRIQKYQKNILKITNVLDVTLNGEKRTSKPFKSESNTPIYIHTASNQPHSIIQQIPISVSRRLSENSSNIVIFNSKKNIYNHALKLWIHTKTRIQTSKTKPKEIQKKKHNLVHSTL